MYPGSFVCRIITEVKFRINLILIHLFLNYENNLKYILLLRNGFFVKQIKIVSNHKKISTIFH